MQPDSQLREIDSQTDTLLLAIVLLVGSARIDENGKAHGGKAGDQTGKEVSTQNWYLHSKGWRVFRVKNPSVAEKIAQCMERACKNSKIGYVSISDDAAVEHFYCYCRKEDEKKYLAWFQAVERRFL